MLQIELTKVEMILEFDLWINYNLPYRLRRAIASEGVVKSY